MQERSYDYLISAAFLFIYPALHKQVSLVNAEGMLPSDKR